MSNYMNSKEPMLELFIFESNQLLEQLEELLIESEKNNNISTDDVNEIFRIMHTIKGSSAMMMYTGISTLAHALEDLFHYIREAPKSLKSSQVCDFALRGSDFIRNEITKIDSGKEADGDNSRLVGEIRAYLEEIKSDTKKENTEHGVSPVNDSKTPQKYYITSKKSEGEAGAYKYKIQLFFESDCQMENIRAYSIVHNMKDNCSELFHRPSKLFDNPNAAEEIIKSGFDIYICSNMDEQSITKLLERELFIESFTVTKVESYALEILELMADLDLNEQTTSNETISSVGQVDTQGESETEKTSSKATKQNFISVNVNKLDKLVDLVGEIVITESMVTRNRDLKGLQLENFSKASRQLRKLTDELQDIVMSIRMIPVASTFHKMNRIVRDMSKALQKDAELKIAGEDTEVDKNIIDNLSDPLMHLIRNAMDHGIESYEQRVESGKNMKATIRLEAQNTGGDVTITVADDGKGLDKERILKKARENGLIVKPESEMSDREIFSLVLLPGFSTKEKITEFSGRGVGMDVVKRNIEKLGGNISIESEYGKGTTISIRIPLTLAIVDGMEISVGNLIYTIPTISIKESFKADKKDLIRDTNGNEMIMVRGNCYPIARLSNLFGVISKVTDLSDGIMVMVEANEKCVALFADKLLGEQQVVVKPLPSYLAHYGIKESCIGGCTILGDGSISLILDVTRIIDSLV